MNKQTRSFIAFLGVFILGSIAGGIAGGFTASRFHGTQQLNAVELRAVGQTKINLALLQQLKAGKTAEASRLLETELDSNIITLGAIKGQGIQQVSVEAVEGALIAAAEYRTTNPWATGDASIDTRVTNALGLAQSR